MVGLIFLLTPAWLGLAAWACQGERCQAEHEPEVSELMQHSLQAARWHRHGYYGYSHYNSYSHGDKKKPNILIVIIDDMGFNQVGFRANASGNPDVFTPNMDQLAGEGIIMDRFYATPWCAPSRGALQTGRLDALNPHVANNVWNWQPNASFKDVRGEEKFTPFVGGVQPNTLTLGNRLREMGYRTHLNGKWGIGGGAYLNTPMGMGYDTFMGWYGDSMESCDGTEPAFAAGGAGPPTLNALHGFWRQDGMVDQNSSWCPLLIAEAEAGNISTEELFVGCKSFKEELDDVADEKIRRRSRQIISEHDYKAEPLFLVHALQLLHLPIQYPRRFAPNITGASAPLNADLRAATYGALTYVDWVIGDLVKAFKEQEQYDNTIIFVTSDNGGAIYAGSANNNYPLRGGKFNNFDGGQRVNAFFTGGWVGLALKKYRMKPFTSHTVMAINDLSETLLEMITEKQYPEGGMRNERSPLTGVPMWKAIVYKTQVPRRISYSDSMQLRVGQHLSEFRKIWFTENGTIILDGNWTANFPNNSQFIPDLGYKWVRPCSTPYCHFDLASDPSEQVNLLLTTQQEDKLRKEVRDDWNLFVIDTSRVTSLGSDTGYPEQVSLWTHMGASGPFLNAAAKPSIPPAAQCWCRWIEDDLAVENVTHVVFNLYIGPRCTDRRSEFLQGSLRCQLPLHLTQAPIPLRFAKDMWQTIGFETEDFETIILKAEWDFGLSTFPLPLLSVDWNPAVIEGLRNMNNRTGFTNYANIEKYPFNLVYTDSCPKFDIFTAPTPVTQVTDWLVTAGIFNNPTAGAGNSSGEKNVTGCFPVSRNESVCPSLDNSPPTVDGYMVPKYSTEECHAYCVLWNPEVDV